jgi:uncharacterized protein
MVDIPVWGPFMIDGVFVIDATVHAFNHKADNFKVEWLKDLPRAAWLGPTMGMTPDEGGFKQTFEEFVGSFDHQPEVMRNALFYESQTDVGVYHGVAMMGVYHDGSSPTWVAKEIARQHPGRMFIYGPLYPWKADTNAEIDRMVDDDHIIGLKFYPADLIDDEIKPSMMDTDYMMSAIDHARSRGIKMIAVHKAVPMYMDRVPLEPYFGVGDMPAVLSAFPDMTFEIVHGGMAFLEETINLYRTYDNCTINLEGPAGFAVKQPQALTILLDAFIRAGGHERIFYSSAATGAHPQPILESFWRHRMFGLTDDMKADMLGRNYARHMGWDIDAMKAQLANDEFGLDHPLTAPWSALRPGTLIAR